MGKPTIEKLFADVLEPNALMAEVQAINERMGIEVGNEHEGYNMARAVLIRLARKHGIRNEWTE